MPNSDYAMFDMVTGRDGRVSSVVRRGTSLVEIDVSEVISAIQAYNEVSRELAGVSAESKEHFFADLHDLHRLGRRQEFKRVFRQYSLLAFVTMCMSTWEYLLSGNSQVLACGGRANFFWSYLWGFAGTWVVSASMAEMASMAPINGGVYHWVSEFAPSHSQKYLSYVTGWLDIISWQASTSSGIYITGSLLESLVQTSNPDYVARAWHSTLFMLAFLALIVMANLAGARYIPVIQNISMLVHMVGYCLVIAILWILAPHVPARRAFLEFESHNCMSSMGLSVMIGQLNTYFSLASSASAVHVAEEVQNASVSVPKGMMNALYLSGSMGLLLVITLVLSIPDTRAAIIDDTGYPYMYIMKLAWPGAGLSAVTCILIILLTLGNLSFLASAARLLCAFARDSGLPYQAWLSKVDQKLGLPVNAVIVTGLFSVLMSVINLGSQRAYEVITSISTVAQMACYCIAFACIIHRRISAPTTIPKARWSLGRSGLTLNVLALLYSAFIAFWSSWPTSMPTDLASVNFACIVTVAAVIGATITYYLGGKKTYEGPVTHIKSIQ